MNALEHFEELDAATNCKLAVVDIVLPLPHVKIVQYSASSHRAIKEIQAIFAHHAVVLLEVRELFQSEPVVTLSEIGHAAVHFVPESRHFMHIELLALLIFTK